MQEKQSDGKKFALIGAAGYVAPRHMRAIKDTNNTIVASFDPNDSVGIIDSYFPDSLFFTDQFRFERHLEMLRQDDRSVDYVSICSPNYMHDNHIRLALHANANAICEKPLVINPWHLDRLRTIEQETGLRIYTILQLRTNPNLIQLRQKIQESDTAEFDVVLTYVTRRGAWYHTSWKGDEERSGGVAMNIGVHFFDLLCWLFGKPVDQSVYIHENSKMAGYLQLERAKVRWFLSIDQNDLPDSAKEKGHYAFRSLTMGDQEIDLSGNFTDLHTRVYQEILAGKGFGLDESQQAIELVHKLRSREIEHPSKENVHPYLKS